MGTVLLLQFEAEEPSFFIYYLLDNHYRIPAFSVPAYLLVPVPPSLFALLSSLRQENRPASVQDFAITFRTKFELIPIAMFFMFNSYILESEINIK